MSDSLLFGWFTIIEIRCTVLIRFIAFVNTSKHHDDAVMVLFVIRGYR